MCIITKALNFKTAIIYLHIITTVIKKKFSLSTFTKPKPPSSTTPEDSPADRFTEPNLSFRNVILHSQKNHRWRRELFGYQPHHKARVPSVRTKAVTCSRKTFNKSSWQIWFARAETNIEFGCFCVFRKSVAVYFSNDSYGFTLHLRPRS